MAEKRTLLDIYADILSAIDDGRNKTNIVYKANLNFNRCRRYMNSLIKGGLIKIQTNSPSAWAVTDRGHDFLENYRELRTILSIQQIPKNEE